MSQFIVRSAMRGIVAVILILAPACRRAAEPDDFNRKHANDGMRYKEALIKTIRVAHRIVVTEHSAPSDFPSSEQFRRTLIQAK
jgi:hypothetical protein